MRLLSAITVYSLLWSALASAHAPAAAPPSAVTVGFMHAIHATNEVQKITEFKGMPRKPFDLGVPDPGASGMAIRVADIEGLLPKLKHEGVRVVSKDGELVLWSATLRNVFVKDPNGLNIELVGAPSAPAK